MDGLPKSARVYIAAVVTAGMLLFARGMQDAAFDQPLLLVALVMLSSMTAALKVTLPLTNSGSTMSVSYAVDFAAILLIGPQETMLVTAASAFAQCYVNTKSENAPYRTLFSMATLVITVQATGAAFAWLGGTRAPLTVGETGFPLVGAAGVYFFVNTALVATAVALSSGHAIARTWHNNFLWSAPGYFVGAGAAALAAILVNYAGYWIAPFTFAPLYLTYRTYKVYMGRIEDEQRHVQQTSDLHLATIEALARAIDAKDQMTQLHIRRVQMYAAGMARAAGLAEHEIQGVKTAALLHDIGKLAVPEHILSKPGPLTDEEFQKIRIHPQVGAEIIAAVPFPYPVAPLILSHHERWDGRGYPHGLKGEAIPIGARILTIVDYYDAVTTERPYHRALANESAVELLRHEAGRALDPNLVPIFIDLLPSLAQEFNAEAAPAVDHGASPIAGAASASLAPAGYSAFENIALAHREIYALYEIAQSMGTSLGVVDTMALISSKLAKLIPWSGCALYVYQAETDALKCRFAAGLDAPRLFGTVVTEGAGPIGWVAAHRRILTNADAEACFVAAGLDGETALRSAIVCPLQLNDTFIGCLALYHVEASHYAEDHRRLLERIAEQAGPVIQNSVVFEQTQEDSLTDPLTGLPNRRSMFAHLTRELSRAERLNTNVALIVMDVDGFKTINDTCGHSVGDHALREVATALQQGLRPYDLCVRYAGDEFIVVLADCPRELAEARRAELQERIDAIRLEVRTGKSLQLAVSAGASVFPDDGTTYEALLADADQRMYRNKAVRRGHSPIADASMLPPAEFVPAQPLEPALVSDETRQFGLA